MINFMDQLHKKLVFIGWSGETSRQVAEALHGWIGRVIQGVRPWISTEDIRKGNRWTKDIASQLQDAAVGIFCLTADNLEAPWIHFEAGALAKQIVDPSHVCTYLFGVKQSDISGPLAEFQHTQATKDDTKKLILTINGTLKEPLEKAQLEEAFDLWWPKLESRLGEVPPGGAPPVRSDRELLEEILSTVRGLSRPSQPHEAAGLNIALLEVLAGREEKLDTERHLRLISDTLIRKWSKDPDDGGLASPAPSG